MRNDSYSRGWSMDCLFKVVVKKTVTNLEKSWLVTDQDFFVLNSALVLYNYVIQCMYRQIDYRTGDSMVTIAILDAHRETRMRVRDIINQSLIRASFDYRIHEFSNEHDFIAFTLSETVDLAILDVPMWVEKSINLSTRLLDMSPSTIVIYMSDFPQLMANVFGLNVFAFVLKCDVNEELPLILNRLVHRYIRFAPIVFKTDTYVTHLEAQEFIYAEYTDRCITVYTTSGCFYVRSMSLTRMYQMLPEGLFIQPNSRSIVNMMHIRSIERSMIILKHPAEDIVISRGQFKLIHQRYLRFLEHYRKVR